MAVVTAVDGLAALLDEADALDKAAASGDSNPYDIATIGLPLVRRLAAALRPFTAQVGVEAFEGLRRTVYDSQTKRAQQFNRTHNALLDQCIAAHVAALGEAERLRAERDRAMESISDALAGPNAARNCDFRSPTVAEVTEAAARLRDRFERTRVRMDMAESSLGDIADALGPGRAFMANTGIVASVKSMLSALHDADNTTACVCGHMGTQHVEEEGTGAARECCADGCKCQQFGNVHMALSALRSAILDGPDPTIPDHDCGQPDCECHDKRPAVDWRAQLAKLREVAR